MHLLKYNPDAKTLTEVPPSEFDADPTCRYFYVLGKRAHVPIVTPDGIGEIVWQHPDYQPPSPANTMTEHHRADPKLWATAEKWGANTMDMANCILELRDRIQLLEAAQQAPDPYSGRPSSLTDDQRKTAAAAAEAGARCAIEQLRSKPGSWRPAEPAPSPHPPTLVDRVIHAINPSLTPSFRSDRDEARAAIREVAEWLRSEYPQRQGYGTAWANLLDNEANR